MSAQTDIALKARRVILALQAKAKGPEEEVPLDEYRAAAADVRKMVGRMLAGRLDKDELDGIFSSRVESWGGGEEADSLKALEAEMMAL